MNKKETLELLIKSYGLEPFEVSNYTTDGCGGQYQVGRGWKGAGVDKDGKHVIKFYEPDGFNMAVYEILRQGKDLPVRYVSK
jgi:hypothetical protein